MQMYWQTGSIFANFAVYSTHNIRGRDKAMEHEEIINVPFTTTDENGLVGRECPSCQMYFKIKPGTGIETTQCICPYCGHKDDYSNFSTEDQNAYAISIATKRILEPLFGDFAKSLKTLERSSNNFVQFKVDTHTPEFTIKEYQEKTLETNVTCDNCGLVFSIYGVFSNCPDCGKLNARVIYGKSLDVSNKKVMLAGDIALDDDLRLDFIKDALTGSVAAFDSFGKALVEKHTSLTSTMPNLFQNIRALDRALLVVTGKDISVFLTPADRDFLYKMFQVRHLFEHKAGVIDSKFINAEPSYAGQLGRKYKLSKEELTLFISLMRKLGDAIYKEFEI